VQPANELHDGIALSHGQHFHATIFEIAGMPMKIERPRLIASAGPEIDTLYATADQAASRNGRRAQGVGRFAAWAT